LSNETTVKYSVDASGVEAGISRMRSSMAQGSTAADRLAERMRVSQAAIAEAAANGSNATAREINRLVSQMDRMAATAGKTRAQIMSMSASQMGIANAVKSYETQIEAATKATHSGTAGISRELMVMAHEGLTGNFKRMAGSAMVLGERVNILEHLMSPLGVSIGVAGAAAGAFGYQVYKGYEQLEAFNKAIASTGGYLGISAGQMVDMSNKMTDVHTSLSSVREAMAEVAKTGAFTGAQLQLATRAALAMSSDTGVGADKAAESLSKIQDGVMKWVVDYQKEHHVFTAAQIEEIENFVKLGDTVRATNAIMDDISNAHGKIQADADAHMGTVVQWWNKLKDVVEQTEAKILNLGAAGSIDDQVATQVQKVAAAQANLESQRHAWLLGNVSAAQALLKSEQDTLATLKQQQAVAHANDAQRAKAAAGGDAQTALYDYLHDPKHATPKTKRDDDLADENAKYDGVKLKLAAAGIKEGSQQYQDALRAHLDAVQQINDEYAKKQKKPSQVGSVNADASTALEMRRLVEQQDQQRLEFQRQMGLLSAKDYYDKLHDIESKALQDEIRIEQQRVDALSKSQGSAAYKEAAGKLALLKQQMAGLDQTRDNSIALDQRQDQLSATRFTQGLGNDVSKQADGFSRASATQFMTAEMQKEYDQRYQIIEQFEQRVQQLKEQYAQLPADKQKELETRLQQLQQAQDTELSQLQSFYDQQQQVRDSFSDQMALAMTKLQGEGQTAAQAAADAFTQAWSDSTNALNEFITTGKGNFDQLASGILEDIEKIMLKWAEMQALQAATGGSSGGLGSGGSSSGGGGLGSILSMFGSFFGGSSGAGASASALAAANTAGETGGDAIGTLIAAAGFATGGHVTGPGTGTSDSIPAMLSDGEYVVNASATKKHRGLLDSINSGKLSHFATGGPVLSVGSSSGSSSGTSSRSGRNSTYNMNISVPHGTSRQTAHQQAQAIMRQANIAQKRNG
jgi:lambda family phage tail tape measure protein